MYAYVFLTKETEDVLPLLELPKKKNSVLEESKKRACMVQTKDTYDEIYDRLN